VPRNATEEVALLAPHLQAGSRTLEP
jgi:hypothetical protein